jgi:hypothetical protein
MEDIGVADMAMDAVAGVPMEEGCCRCLDFWRSDGCLGGGGRSNLDSFEERVEVLGLLKGTTSVVPFRCLESIRLSLRMAFLRQALQADDR